MIIALIVDPKAFCRDNFTKLHSQNALVLVRGLKHNAIMLVDSKNIMTEQLKANIKSLPQKLLSKIFVELLDGGWKNKKYIIPCLDFDYNQNFNFVTLYKKIKDSANTQYLDAIIANDDALKSLCSARIIGKEVVPLSAYILSNIEEKRYNYSKFSETLDKIHLDKAKELISRCLWHTKKLSFFDNIIGAKLVTKKNGNNIKINENASACHLQKWLDGLSYILKLWHENDYPKSEPKTINIYTGELFFWKTKDEKWNAFYKKHKNIRLEAKEFINERLIAPLKIKFPWCNNINLHVKKDPENIFRDRHLQTDNFIVNFSKGFDFLKKNGEFKRIYISIKTDVASDLQDIRELEEIN